MHKKFDLIAIGAGSGGLAAVTRATQLGATCAIIEPGLLGGTCVNVGCVPKKFHWLAANVGDTLKHANDFGYSSGSAALDWNTLVTKRQAYIEKLHAHYQKRLDLNGITLIRERAQFISPHVVQAGEMQLTAPHIIIATGGTPTLPKEIDPSLALDSDGFFALTALPKRVAVVGAGYIAVELAGMLKSYGCDTTLVYRHDTVLREFDPFLSKCLIDAYTQQGIVLQANHVPARLTGTPGNLTLQCVDKPALTGFDAVIFATGRHPNTSELNLPLAGIAVNEQGAITVDKYQNTNVAGLYAIGDVTGKVALTPVAVAAGRRLAMRLFDNQSESHLDYGNIPSVVFSHPPLGAVGMTEPQAQKQFPNAIKIYQTAFTPMCQAFSPTPVKTAMKLVTHAVSGKVLGCHLFGDNVDEILQGFAVAIKMGATKSDFDQTVAIHPTSAEELVTLV